jgi:hypothetical protein
MENIDKQALFNEISIFIIHHFEDVRPQKPKEEPRRGSRGANFRKREDNSTIRRLFRKDSAASAARMVVNDACVAPPLPSNFSSAVIDRLEDSFGTLLVKAINKRGLNNADVYKDANIDRRLFSKIISNEGYSPTKGTVLALAIALKLDLDETSSFLKSAGYALSHSSKADIIVEYFIAETNGNYNIDIVNDALVHFNQPTLGSRL